MNFLVSTTWAPGTAYDPARSFVTCTLSRRFRRQQSLGWNQELMLRVDRVLADGPLRLGERELQQLLGTVRTALTTARANAEKPTAGPMEAAYWCYQVARLQQCRRLLESRAAIRL